MKYRFSPIKSKEELLSAIEYTHFACLDLCERAFGKYLPIAGNIGIFCHDDEEYEFLTKLRKELTDSKNNWNKKYFRLYDPIVIPEKDGVPRAKYTYLYIRRPDPEKPQVGDVDLVLEPDKFSKLKSSKFINGGNINGIDVFYRPDLDMFRLSSSDSDALSYITSTFMNQKGI